MEILTISYLFYSILTLIVPVENWGKSLNFEIHLKIPNQCMIIINAK